MDKHRTRFLASLSARLDQDRAMRDSEAETPPIWRRHTEQSDPARAPVRPEIAEVTGPFANDPEPDVAAPPYQPEPDVAAPYQPEPEVAAPYQPEPDVAAPYQPEPDDVAAPYQIVARPRSPDPRRSTVEALRRREPDQTSVAAVPWSETGMSQALRDAIASVRRVSRNEMDELPPPCSDQAPYGQPPFSDDPAHGQASERFGTDEWSSSDEDVLREERPFDDATADERFDDRALREEPPFAAPMANARQSFDHAAAADEQHDFERGGAAARSPLDQDGLREDPSFDAEADAPPFGDRGPREEASFDLPAADEQPRFGDQAADEQPPFDNGRDERWGYGPRQDLLDRPPLWRGVTQRRGLPFAAFAVATMFVLLAGFGLGILSGARELDRLVATLGWTPLADKIAGATQRDPAPSSTDPARTSGAGVTRPAEPGSAPQLSELETVEVAPLPAPPRVEQPPGQAANDMPLPPPPKPALQSSLSGEGPPASDRVDGAVDDAVDAAAVALLEADGAGGPFEPILVKTSASGPRVFVHYTESAPGSPATALHLVRHLKAAGFAVEGRAVEFPIPESSIRYFFDTDRDEAEAVSARLEGQVPGNADVPILDFTSYQPKPREGHLELWLGR